MQNVFFRHAWFRDVPAMSVTRHERCLPSWICFHVWTAISCFYRNLMQRIWIVFNFWGAAAQRGVFAAMSSMIQGKSSSSFSSWMGCEEAYLVKFCKLYGWQNLKNICIPFLLIAGNGHGKKGNCRAGRSLDADFHLSLYLPLSPSGSPPGMLPSHFPHWKHCEEGANTQESEVRLWRRRPSQPPSISPGAWCTLTSLWSWSLTVNSASMAPAGCRDAHTPATADHVPCAKSKSHCYVAAFFSYIGANSAPLPRSYWPI